jgi:hypothetical protein
MVKVSACVLREQSGRLRQRGFEAIKAMFELPLFGRLFTGLKEAEAFWCGVGAS